MRILLIGGSKSGKSTMGQRLTRAFAAGAPMYYWATMEPTDEEDRARIARHRAERAGWGFETLECGSDILSCLDRADANGSFLLDSVTALLSNEMFSPDGFHPEAAAKIADELCRFVGRAPKTVLVSDFIYVKIHNRGIWNDEKDVNHSSNVVNELVAARAAQNDAKARPSFGMALLPVVIPVVCILFGTLGTAVFDEEPLICSFLGNKLVAMTLGTLGAYLVSLPYIGRENLEKSAGEALKSAGVVLLITGAGGSFSSGITATGIGNAIVSLLGTNTTSVIPAMFLAYFIGLIFRVAQGSGTVAGMTSMGIMATIAPAIGCHPVWLALACLSGGNSIGHVNDSGFWVATNMSGLTVTGGLKTYTLGSFISSVCIFVLALIGALIIPL